MDTTTDPTESATGTTGTPPVPVGSQDTHGPDDRQESLARAWFALFELTRRRELFPEKNPPTLAIMLGRAGAPDLRDLCILMDLPSYGIDAGRLRERIEIALGRSPTDPEPHQEPPPFPEEIQAGFELEAARRREQEHRNASQENAHRKRVSLFAALAVGLLAAMGTLSGWVWFLDVTTALAAGWTIAWRRSGRIESTLILGTCHGVWAMACVVPDPVVLMRLFGSILAVACIGSFLGIGEDTRDV